MIKLTDLYKESFSERQYQVHGKIIMDSTKRQVSDVLSDIRSITGVTIVTVTNNSNSSAESNPKHTIEIDVKLDPSPFEKFDRSIINSIEAKIRKIPSMRYAKFDQTIKLTKKDD